MATMQHLQVAVANAQAQQPHCFTCDTCGTCATGPPAPPSQQTSLGSYGALSHRAEAWLAKPFPVALRAAPSGVDGIEIKHIHYPCATRASPQRQSEQVALSLSRKHVVDSLDVAGERPGEVQPMEITEQAPN